MRSTSKKSSVVSYSLIVIAAIAVVFSIKYMMDVKPKPVAMASTGLTSEVDTKKNHNLFPDEVYAEADFKTVEVSPSEAQGVDSRWETARMVRAVSSDMVTGPGSINDSQLTQNF